MDQASKASNSAQDARDAVLELLNEGAVAHAVTVFDAALKRWPASSPLLLLKSDVLARSEGRYRAAIYCMELLENPSLAQWAAQRLTRHLEDKTTPFDEVRDLARRACRISDPKVKQAAIDLIFARDDPAEQQNLLDIIAPDSGLFRYELKMAVRKTEAQDLAGAESILAKARADGKLSAQGALLYSDILAVNGRAAEGVKVIEEQLRKEPEHKDLHRKLVMMLQRSREFERAADVFEASVRKWPHDWMFVYRLNRMPARHERLKRMFDIISNGCEAALEKNEHFRLFYARVALLVGEIVRGKELLEQPFKTQAGELASPVQKALSARTPEQWKKGSRLADDRTKEVQIVRTPNARATVILPVNVYFGTLPHAMIDTLFAERGVNVVYLRSFGKLALLQGIETLGSSEQTTVAALRDILNGLGAPKTIMMGASSGGFSAMRYGALLDADFAVSFSGQTHLSSFYDGAKISAWNPDFFSRLLAAREPDLPMDLVPVLESSPRTKFIQYYGEGHPEDVRQARRLEGMPNVDVIGVPGVRDHFVIDHLIGDGSFDKLLEQLTD